MCARCGTGDILPWLKPVLETACVAKTTSLLLALMNRILKRCPLGSNICVSPNLRLNLAQDLNGSKRSTHDEKTIQREAIAKTTTAEANTKKSEGQIGTKKITRRTFLNQKFSSADP